MRVLLVNKYAYVTGGADRQCLALARALRERGHEIAILSTASAENVEIEGAFVPVSVTHDTRDELSVVRRVEVAGRALWNRAAADATRGLLRDFRPDVVHAHKLYPQLSVAPVAVAQRHGLPIVQTLHDYEFIAANPLDARGRGFDRQESRIGYRALNSAMFLMRRRVHVPAIARWIAVSDFVARAHERRGIRSTVIPNFADTDTDTDADVGQSPDSRRGILFLGTLSREKGASDALELAEALPEQPFVIGGRGPLEALVVRAAQRLPNLEFRGLLDPRAAIDAMRTAKCVIVPSRWEEPGALVAVEAMSAGTPVVAYRRGGLSEYVTTSGAGLVVEPGPAELLHACRRVLDDRDLWRRCSQAGLEATRTLFSRAAHTDAVIDVYERAAQRS